MLVDGLNEMLDKATRVLQTQHTSLSIRPICTNTALEP